MTVSESNKEQPYNTISKESSYLEDSFFYYRRYLWIAENNIAKGFDGDYTWYTYDDNGVKAIGPGIRLFNSNISSLTTWEVSSLLDETIHKHIERAKQYYPRWRQLTLAQRVILLDYTYMGIKAPKFYQAALNNDNHKCVSEINIKSKRRKTLMLTLYQVYNNM